MTITKDLVAGKLSDYLHHEMTLDQLVDWAETAMMEGEFDTASINPIRDVVGRIGLADVRAFGLAWVDCEAMLEELGYEVELTITSG